MTYGLITWTHADARRSKPAPRPIRFVVGRPRKIPHRTAAALRAEAIGEEWCEARLPIAHRLVREHVSALEEQLRHVAEAEPVAQAPQHGEHRDIGREADIVEGRAGPFVEAAPTCAASEPAVAELRPASSARCLVGSAVRASHERILAIARPRLPQRALGSDRTRVPHLLGAASACATPARGLLYAWPTRGSPRGGHRFSIVSRSRL
jgi:hypothetical protein